MRDKIEFYREYKKTRELMKKRRNGFEFLPMKESEFMKLSFPEIFDYFRESI